MGLLADFNVEVQETYAPTIYEKFATFAPQYAPTLGYQLDYAYAPNIQIESPGAIGSQVTTKKEMTQTPEQVSAIEQSPTVTPSQVGPQSDPMGIILILGLVAVGGYILVSMVKKKRK